MLICTLTISQGETDMKSSKKYFYYILYILPVMLLNNNSFIYAISAFSSKSFDNVPKHNIMDNSRHNKMLYFVFTFIFGVILCFTMNFLYFFGSKQNNLEVKISNTTIIPTYTIFIYIIVAIIWKIAHKNHKKEKIHLIQIFYAIGPMIVASIITGIITPIYYNTKMLYINQLWQSLFVAAFLEELYFRGYLYENCKKIMNYKVARVLTSLIFTLWHMNLMMQVFKNPNINIVTNIIAVFVLGLITSELYDRTNNRLIVPILYHAINNGFVYYMISGIVI